MGWRCVMATEQECTRPTMLAPAQPLKVSPPVSCAVGRMRARAFLSSLKGPEEGGGS
jgi:hypothetical protein